MKAPIEDLNQCLAILMLKAAKCSNDTVAGVLHCYKGTVGEVEKWFRNLPDDKAAELCDPQRINNAFWLKIMQSDEEVDYQKMAVVAKMDTSYILGKYEKTEKSAKPSLLTPEWHVHYARLTDAAERLRQNIKAVKNSNGQLIGNVTAGHIQVSKNVIQKLLNVDRLDAECLLSHLQATFSAFKDISDWQDLTSRDKVVQLVSDSLVKKLKEVSHGLALKGSCQICASWS